MTKMTKAIEQTAILKLLDTIGKSHSIRETSNRFMIGNGHVGGMVIDWETRLRNGD